MEDKIKINVGEIAGGGERLRTMQRKRSGEKIERKKSRGAQKDREREERLLTSTGGHREEEVTTSFFRIQGSCLIWPFVSFF